jgi:hypothetical protein
MTPSSSYATSERVVGRKYVVEGVLKGEYGSTGGGGGVAAAGRSSSAAREGGGGGVHVERRLRLVEEHMSF